MPTYTLLERHRPTSANRTASIVIFKAIGNGRPYPEHGLTQREWSTIPPQQIRLDELTTTKRELALDALLDEASTFYGDLFTHVVRWRGESYLEDGLHRALRSALHQRTAIHARVLDLDKTSGEFARRLKGERS